MPIQSVVERGATPEDAPPIFERLKIKPAVWYELVTGLPFGLRDPPPVRLPLDVLQELSLLEFGAVAFKFLLRRRDAHVERHADHVPGPLIRRLMLDE